MNKKIGKWLNERERTRYYQLSEVNVKRRTDSDNEEIAELEQRAQQRLERDTNKHNNTKRDW